MHETWHNLTTRALFFVNWGWYCSEFWYFSLGFSWSEGIKFTSSHMFVLFMHDHKRDSVGCKRACYGVRACMKYLQCHIKTTVHIREKLSNEGRHYLSLQNNFRNKPCKVSGLCLSKICAASISPGLLDYVCLFYHKPLPSPKLFIFTGLIEFEFLLMFDVIVGASQHGGEFTADRRSCKRSTMWLQEWFDI